MISILLAAAIATTGKTPPQAIGALDPARLVAARKVVDDILPPAKRDMFFSGIVNAMMNNVVAGLEQSPDIAKALQQKPELRVVFKSFVDRQKELALQDLSENMPAFIEADVRAYARLFTLDDLQQLDDFLSRPIGAKYLEMTPRIFAEPEMAAWQSGVMIRAQQRKPTEIKRFLDQIAAVKGEGKDHDH